MKNLSSLLAEPIPHPKDPSPQVKRKIAVIDAETDPFLHARVPRPFLWGFYDGDVYEEFDHAELMLSYLADVTTPLRIYAHNGGKFDYHFLLPYLEADSEIMIINGRLSRFKIGNVEFRDSYNLFNFPLSAYKKDDMDYAIMEVDERAKPANARKISVYLQKDCLYLYELVTGFIESYGSHMSQAGAAMKLWQKMEGIKAAESSPSYYDDISKYYYGGRVTAFKKGIIKHPFKMIDIVSAYPYAMMSNHPSSLSYKTYTGREVDRLICTLPSKIMDTVISSCMITISCKSKGALPYRDTDIDKLTFPDDNILRLYTITGWELQAGLRCNAITKLTIIKVLKWHDLVSFKEYVKKFFVMKSNAKATGDRLNELFAKLFLNALYGKFAADPRNYKSYKIAYPTDINNYLAEGYSEGGFLGEWFLAAKPLAEDRQRFYNVATAASITGFVRAYLFEAMQKCKGVLYCDTDSIAAVNIDGVELSNELGGWSIDGEFSYGGIGGRKMYAFRHIDGGGWKTASKGVRISPEEIIKVSSGQNITYKPISPTFSVGRPPRFTNRTVKLT